jgi:hypothetical protein
MLPYTSGPIPYDPGSDWAIQNAVTVVSTRSQNFTECDRESGGNFQNPALSGLVGMQKEFVHISSTFYSTRQFMAYTGSRNIS